MKHLKLLWCGIVFTVFFHSFSKRNAPPYARTLKSLESKSSKSRSLSTSKRLIHYGNAEGSYASYPGQKPFVILIATYNNEPFCEENLLSALNQDYENYRIIIVNDASTERTLEKILGVLKESGQEHRVIIVDNAIRQGAMYNHYHTIHDLILDFEIVVILDGDDRLHDNQVLAYLNTIYSDPTREIWLTYGQFMNSNAGTLGFCCPMPEHIVHNNAFREWSHGPSHLRTFYAWLFKRIKKEDLMWRGNFFEMTCDLAAMFPMIEMARDHFMFIDRVLLDYNDSNPLSDHRKNYNLQRDIDVYLRKQPHYTPLEKAPFPLN